MSKVTEGQHAHGGLHSINRHEQDSEQRSGNGSRNSLRSNRQISSHIEGIQSCQGTSICGSVTETRERALKKGWHQTTIKARNTAISIQSLECLSGGGSVSVLVVDGGTHPHEGANVNGHGGGSGQSSLSSTLGGLLQDCPSIQLGLFGLGSVAHVSKKFKE